MRKIKIIEHITLDGGIQAPGAPGAPGEALCRHFRW